MLYSGTHMATVGVKGLTGRLLRHVGSFGKDFDMMS